MDSSLKSLILSFWCCAGQCADLSIMLSSTEEAALTCAQDKARTGGTGQVMKLASLRLDGIIFSHHKSWTIWINGRSIKPGQKIESVRIIKVTPEAVDLIWTPNPGENHQVCLKPNEAFPASSALPDS